MTPADAIRLFDARARAHLRSTGSAGTRADVARAVGMSRSHYANIVAVGAGWASVFRLVERWRAWGGPPLGVLGTVASKVEGTIWAGGYA